MPTTPGREGASSRAAAPRVVHRLRDLDRGGRWLALAFALALSLPPALAFRWALPDWAPVSDAALMGIRALDVGTARTPLIGQPSTAGMYIGSDDLVNHPGPTHFYLMAVPIRLFGGDVGMLLVSVLIVAVCVLLAAWGVFRELGGTAGIVAAVLLGAIMFTTGAPSFIDPTSSRMAGYPLLCASVLCWCVLSGDLRLLPLATAVASFTAQQHLSVAPAIVVLSASTVVALVVALVRRRAGVVRWCGWSVLVALVVWAPVLLDELIGPDGNLGRIVRFAGSSDRARLGTASAVNQIAHSIGLPPLLGRTGLTGGTLSAEPSTLTAVSAVVAIVIVAALGLRWRTSDPRRATLAPMVAVLGLVGLTSGSSVPVGYLEELRIVFYHWSFALAFFTWLVVGLGVLDLFRSQLAARSPHAPALTALALAAIVVPAVMNPSLDGTAGSLPRRYFRQLGDAVIAHRDELGGQTVLLGRGQPVLFAGFPQGLAFELTDRGFDVRHPLVFTGYVHDDRLVERETVDTGLVLIVDTAAQQGRPPRGKLLADVDLESKLDVRAFEALVAQAQSGRTVRRGRAADAALEQIPDPFLRQAFTLALDGLVERPRQVLTAQMLRFLRDHPIEQPRLDRALIDRVLATVPDTWTPDAPARLRLYLVDREELLRVSPQLSV
jgi:hypothetical protein